MGTDVVGTGLPWGDAIAQQTTSDWIPSGCHCNDAPFRADASGTVAARAAY
jgi:hypothetical protein